MAIQSLKTCQAGIDKARIALTSKGWTHEKLAQEAKLQTRQPVANFFAGKGVKSDNFVKICELLDLDWQEITGASQTVEQPSETLNIDALVQEIREKIKSTITKRCDTIRVLDMTQPIGLNDIYTSVNILEKITGHRRLEIADLIKNCDPKNFERFGLGRVTQERLPGLKAVQQYNQLMVLGKPGAGKTTFLKHLAFTCACGDFQSNRVPFFITLRDFAETLKLSNILDYITYLLSGSNVTDAKIKAEHIVKQGRAFILLDGLDEVREEDGSRVIKQIRDFTEQYFENQIVITCRIAAKEYIFERFVEVEVADFDDQQIISFANSWFKIRKPGKTEKFIQKLSENQRIKELATNPLLLTLLCLIFEEKGKFKNNRSELYEEGIELLLEKWDDSREIEREQIYKNLSIRRKEDLLSKIAFITFETGDYFFKNKQIIQIISEYIYNLPNTQDTTEALSIDSKKVLKSVEAQHGLLVERAKGIYSFSHLTFHEYFTAKEIIATSAWQALVMHITDKRWQEVFLLTTGMMQKADNLLILMKSSVDNLIESDEKLQSFLEWFRRKCSKYNTSNELIKSRFFCFAFSINLVQNLSPSTFFYDNEDEAIDNTLVYSSDYIYNIADDLNLNPNDIHDVSYNIAEQFARNLICNDIINEVIGSINDYQPSVISYFDYNFFSFTTSSWHSLNKLEDEAWEHLQENSDVLIKLSRDIVLEKLRNFPNYNLCNNRIYISWQQAISDKDFWIRVSKVYENNKEDEDEDEEGKGKGKGIADTLLDVSLRISLTSLIPPIYDLIEKKIKNKKDSNTSLLSLLDEINDIDSLTWDEITYDFKEALHNDVKGESYIGIQEILSSLLEETDISNKYYWQKEIKEINRKYWQEINREIEDLHNLFKEMFNKNLQEEIEEKYFIIKNQQFTQWWQTNSHAWTQKLRNVLICDRDIGYDWDFSDLQQKALQQYYDANKLLFDCLNGDCYVSREVRRLIEDTFLL